MLLSTLLRILISLLIAYIVSFLIITFYHLYKPTINIFKPFLSLMKSMPVIILTLIIWLLLDVNIGIYIITKRANRFYSNLTIFTKERTELII